MKVLVLNGSLKGDNELKIVHEIIVDVLEDNGCDIDSLILHEIEIASCLGCFGCWVKTPGICVINDEGRDIAKAVIQSNLLIFLTPVIFGGYSSELKKALDRLIPIISPFFEKIEGEIHHQRRYDQYPRLIGVGVLPNKDEKSEQIFNTLIYRNTINMHSPSYASGVVYSNQEADEIRKNFQRFLAKVGVGK